MLGAPIDNEDLTDKILEELGDEYRELVRAVQARENAISFDELHENAKKYLNRIEELTDTRISIVSVGPKRSQTIRVKEI